MNALLIPQDGARQLLHNLLAMAVKDAYKGDQEARAFLLDAGADLAHWLGVVDDPELVIAWARDPQQPNALDTQQVADLVGCRREYVAERIRKGDIIAYKDPFSGHSNKYMVPVSEAKRFVSLYGRAQQ
jgi:hypothetical protein